MFVHHLENSRSQRVIWLLEELNLNYEIINHKREPGTRAAEQSLRAVHPLAKAPVLCDKDVVLAETAAIFAYLLEQYGNGKLEPSKDTAQRIQYIYWMHFAEGSLMPYLAMKLVFARMVERAPFFARPLIKFISRSVGVKYLNPNLRLEIDAIELHLSNFEWFAGSQFTAADILMGFMLEAIAGRMTDGASHPNIMRFINAMHARSAYQKAALLGKWSVSDHANYWKCLAE